MNNYSVKFKSGSVDVNISSYVTDIGNVPYIIRNMDYTIVTDGYDMRLSSTLPNIVDMVEETQVFVYSGSVLIHNGRVKEKTYDYGKREYTVKVKHAMLDLENKRNVISVMNPFIAPFTQSVTFFTDRPVNLIKHNDLITAHFSASGYTLDWSTYYNSASISLIATTGYLNDADWNHVMVNWRADQIYYLPQAMYCINQTRVMCPEVIENVTTWAIDPTTIGNIIWTTNPNTATEGTILSSLDVINMLSTMYGYNYIPKESGSFYVVSDAMNFPIVTISDDDKLEYKEKIYTGVSGVKVSFDSLTMWTSYDTSLIYPRKGRWFNDSPAPFTQLYYVSDAYDYNFQDKDPSNDIQSPNRYEFGTSKNGKQLKWYNHLVPIALFDDNPYLIYPGVASDDTIIYLQRRALLDDGVEKTAETLSKSLWEQSTLYQFQSVIFKDLREDRVELVWRESL